MPNRKSKSYNELKNEAEFAAEPLPLKAKKADQRPSSLNHINKNEQ